MPGPFVDLMEVEQVFTAVAGSGGQADTSVDITGLGTGRAEGMARARIFEVVGDSNSTDFDIEIYEADTRTRLNRIFRVEDINLHTVQRLLDGQQYRDRDVTGAVVQPRFHLRVINTAVGANDITVRIRYLLFYSR